MGTAGREQAMILRKRLDRLETNRPAQPAGTLELDLPREIAVRVEAALASDTFPRSLCDADLHAILAAKKTTKVQT
jgi:hypothetical protein